MLPDNQNARLHDSHDTPFWWEMGIQNAEARESLAAASFPSYKQRAKRGLRRSHRVRRSTIDSNGQDNALLHQEWTPVVVINNIFNENDSDHSVFDNVFLSGNQLDGELDEEKDRYVDQNEIGDVLETEVVDGRGVMTRVKRKSGKTTGALSRAKGSGSDSSSKSITRHNKQGEVFPGVGLGRFGDSVRTSSRKLMCCSCLVVEV